MGLEQVGVLERVAGQRRFNILLLQDPHDHLWDLLILKICRSFVFLGLLSFKVSFFDEFFEVGVGANEMGLFMLITFFVYVLFFIFLNIFEHSCRGRRSFLIFLLLYIK